jgi:dipeptidyl aminopeptidase/acylaminoacyl peptidase
MSKRLLPGLVLLLLLFPPVAAVAAPPLEDMVRRAEFTGVSLSPDGRHLAVATPVDERTCLTVLNIEVVEQPSMVLQSCPPGGESVTAMGLLWANNERILFRTTRQLGNLAQPVWTGRIFAINIDGKNGRQIHGPVLGAINFVYSDVSIIDMLRDDPEHILVSTMTLAVHSERLNPRVERVNVYNGRSQFVVDSPLDRGFILTDHRSRVRFATGWSVDAEQSFAWRPDEESDWLEFRSPFESDIYPLSFTADEKGILVSSRQEGELGVWHVDLETGERRRLLANDRSEMRSAIFDAEGTELIGARFEPDYPVYEFIDSEHEDTVLWRRVMAAFPGREVSIAGFTRDRSRAVVSVTGDREPTTWYLMNTEDMQLRFLLASQGWIDPGQLSVREPFRIRARDGLELTGYLTLPPDGRDAGLPAVMLVHGGPHGPRDTWSYDLEAQLLASRGYAVVQLNFRGSGGYGQQFERAGYRKWGTAMQDDVTDATRWLIAEGIADPERICIYGGSYGGYAVLAGITREPDLYACAFTYVGVYDLDMMFKHGDIPQRDTGVAFLTRVLGDRRADAADIAARSPVNHVAKIRTPLYVAHGRKDERVPIAQYNALTRALDRAGIPYEKLVFRNEGHGISDPENRVTYYSELLNFLDKHTGGAAGR